MSDNFEKACIFQKGTGLFFILRSFFLKLHDDDTFTDY